MLVYTKQARRDARKLASGGLKTKAEELLAILERDPFHSPPPYEKLVGDLAGAYSRRINIQHRLVYGVLESERIVKVIRMWTHYDWAFSTGSVPHPRPSSTISIGGVIALRDVDPRLAIGAHGDRRHEMSPG